MLRRLTLIVGEPFDQLSPAAAVLEKWHRPGEALEFRRARVRAVPWDADASIRLARTELAAAQTPAEAFARLSHVAESAAIPYAIRVEAAEVFRANGGRVEGPPRTEIDALRGAQSLTAAAVARPMYVEARIAAAAASGDPAVRLQLLLDALATDPSHPGVRLPLFRAALAAKKAADALAAVGPVIDRDRSLTRLGLGAAARASLARELADAYQQVDQLPEAVHYLRIAAELEKGEARAAVRQRIASIESELRRRATNDDRRPHVSAAVDQPSLVRPRIPPRTMAERPAQGAGE